MGYSNKMSELAKHSGFGALGLAKSNTMSELAKHSGLGLASAFGNRSALSAVSELAKHSGLGLSPFSSSVISNLVSPITRNELHQSKLPKTRSNENQGSSLSRSKQDNRIVTPSEIQKAELANEEVIKDEFPNNKTANNEGRDEFENYTYNELIIIIQHTYRSIIRNKKQNDDGIRLVIDKIIQLEKRNQFLEKWFNENSDTLKWLKKNLRDKALDVEDLNS